MRQSTNNVLEQEIPIEEEQLEEISDEKRDKILKLYESIQILKDVISSKILKELKTCKKSCEDANIVIEGIHGDVKKQ